MDKTKKIDKEYCITDDSVNVYKYRCLTSGLLLDEFKKNPIGFHMHNRDKGVVVRWEDFRIEGSKVFAKPVVNLSHPDGQSIVDDIENGFLNAASAGKIVCLAATDESEFKLPNQEGPTITKWFPREISLVDIPGNFNALTNLVDIDDNELNLADFLKPKNSNMSKTMIAATLLTALNLSDNSSEAEINKVFQDLFDKAERVPGLEKDLSDSKTKIETLTKDLSDKATEISTLKEATTTKEVADLVAKGQEDKKLTKEVAEKLTVAYANNPTGLKDLLDSMPAQVSIADSLKDLKTPDAYAGKSWDDLYQSDDLEKVRTQFPDLYAKLRKEKYPNLKD